MKCVTILCIVSNVFTVFKFSWINYKDFIFEASMALLVCWLSSSSPRISSRRKHPWTLLSNNKMKWTQSMCSCWFQLHSHNINWTSDLTHESNRVCRNCDILVGLSLIKAFRFIFFSLILIYCIMLFLFLLYRIQVLKTLCN